MCKEKERKLCEIVLMQACARVYVYVCVWVRVWVWVCASVRGEEGENTQERCGGRACSGEARLSKMPKLGKE